jgi:hypothetical protein
VPRREEGHGPCVGFAATSPEQGEEDLRKSKSFLVLFFKKERLPSFKGTALGVLQRRKIVTRAASA